jgi:hypothetical protein
VDAVALLPLAFVMIAGPQIVTSVILAASDRWKAASAAYVAGGTLAITAAYTIFYFIAHSAGRSSDSGHKSSNHALDIAVLVILAILLVLVFRARHRGTPKWMTKLQSARPRFTLILGLLLLGIFPTDLASSATAGTRLASDHSPWAYGLPFLALTAFLLALPALLVVTLGARAERWLPAVRDWMNAHSWIISEAVIAFFIASTIQKLLQ